MEKESLRSEIDNKYKWDLEKIYKNKEEVEKDMQKAKELTEEFLKYKTHILDTSKTLEEATTKYYEISRLMEKFIVYANMKFHEDMSISENEALVGKIDKLTDELSEKLAFYTPELLESEYEKIEQYTKENKNLEKYSFIFKELFREKAHVLSLKEEEMMARLGEIFQVPTDAFHMLDDVNIKFKKIKDENEKEVELNNSNYSIYIKSKDRRVRKEAFESLFTSYEQLKNTFASLLKGNVKSNFFISRTRKYKNPLQMSLYGDNINEKLYTGLIEKVHNNLDIMYDYMDVRKKVLNIDELHMYDLYAPLATENEKHYTYEEGKELVIKALEPLGKDYIENLKKLFESNCIDVYHNKNKRSGAYSWGSYDTHPYVLLNYEGKFTDVSTIAHELGHSMHSFYSVKNQEYHSYGYPIFLAEIASTVNEILLNRYCSKNASTKEEKIFFLNNLLENYRTTLIRQTMFAEFELKIHKLEEEGKILTAEELSNQYLELNKKYFGENTKIDELIAYEWARIPHFYTSFYVYKYATGIAVASKIVSDIEQNKEDSLKNYIEFLSSGGSDYPLEILKKVGIDIENDDTIDKALDMFRETLNEFKTLI